MSATGGGFRVEVGPRANARVPGARLLTRWAAAALGRQARGKEIALRAVTAAESRRLNRQYRGKDKPTNILSFPAPALAGVVPMPLGDLVICPAVVSREAREQGKSQRAHWAHLIVHGTLHLVGYDHEQEADAVRMERREIAVLRRLGFPNPYSIGAATRARLP